MSVPLSPEIGIMQGRLLPPLEGRVQAFPASRWRDEFDLAARLGIRAIEWIYEEANESRNPLATRIAEIQEAVEATGVRVPAICADYFMDRPWVTADRRGRRDLSNKLAWLVECAASLGAVHIDLPFLERSSLREVKRFADVREFMQPAMDVAADRFVLVCLETDLDPATFRNLIEYLDHPAVAVCYDSGNSASLGHDLREEFEAYGDRIRTVHIKDRLLGGRSVPLGTGDADFGALFEQLKNVRYAGPLVLQPAREDDDVTAAMRSLAFVIERVNRASRPC